LVFSISHPPLLAVRKVGVVIALEVAEPGTEEASELELDVDDAAAVASEVFELCDDTDSDEEDFVGAWVKEAVEVPELCNDVDLDEEVVSGPVVDGAAETGLVVLGLGLGTELELEPPAGTTTPPCTLPTDCDDEVRAALAL